MKSISTPFASCLSAFALLLGDAQGQTPTPPPCEAAAHAQFDFWLGEWDLRWLDPSGREVTGFNRIAKIYGGCVLLEEFDGRDGTPLRGGSISSYDIAASKWKQVWVDNQGSWLDFEGGVSDGNPIFIRRVGADKAQRMVFRDVKKDALIWDWESSADGGKTWARQWRIQYTRRR